MNDKKIWLTSQGMVIYEPKSFFAVNSIQSKGKAVYELDKTIKSIFKLLELEPIRYKFKTSREHFGMINNELARQYNEKGEKLYIHREDGTAWMWIDDSHAFNELENDEMLLNKKVQVYYNDLKKHNFELTTSKILEMINGLTNHNQQLQTQIDELKRPKIDKSDVLDIPRHDSYIN